jgi:hypothetical protein
VISGFSSDLCGRVETQEFLSISGLSHEKVNRNHSKGNPTGTANFAINPDALVFFSMMVFLNQAPIPS